MYKAYSGIEQTLCAAVFFIFVIESAWKKDPGHSKQRQSRGNPSYLTRYFYRNLVQLHGAGQESRYTRLKTTVPKPPRIFNDHRACV